MNPQKERIWELDAFRGLCLLGMIAVQAEAPEGVQLPDAFFSRVHSIPPGIQGSVKRLHAN